MYECDGIEFQWPATVMFQSGGEFTFGREPTLRRMPDGTLRSFIYTGGPREPAPENVAAMIRSTDDGATWSAPEVTFRHPFRCTWGTELFTDCERPFAVFQTFAYETNYCELRSFRSFTDDSGRSWSTPESFPGVPSNFSTRQGKVLSDGSWIFPVYWVEQRADWDFRMVEHGVWPCRNWVFVSGVLRSGDAGKSFTLHGAVRTPTRAWEPEVTELEPGRLRMFVRNDDCDGRRVLYESDSSDGGRTWSPAVPGCIPNPGTKTVIYRVRGRHVLVNNVCDNSPGNLFAKRNRLELWISSDNCRGWERKLPLALLRGTGDFWSTVSQVAYPHGFADDERETLYLAIDAVRKFYLVKIPYADLLG